MSTTDICRTCNQPRSWHEANHPRHAFMSADGSTPLKTDDSVAVTSHVDLPFDPILRMALINNGILTAAQLSQAEKDFRAINGGGDAHNGRSE